MSLLSLFVASDAWFLNLKSDKIDKMAKTTPAPNTRKVILVARKVYVPMYASEDAATSGVSGRLLPVSPVLATSGAVMGGLQQQPIDYSSMYQPPVVAYAMSDQGSDVMPAAYSAPLGPTDYAAPVAVPDNADAAFRQYANYAMYPEGYAAAVPQYVQYPNAPVGLPQVRSLDKILAHKYQISFFNLGKPWMLPYGGSDFVPAGFYSPTGTYGETVTQELAAPLQLSEANPSV